MGQSLTDQVYEMLKKDIITCVLQPGQQIAQPELAERYQAGLTPIRDALHRLAQEGLVQPIPRFGYIVAPITFSDVTEIYELRSILESAAARLAALRAPKEQLDQIVELADCIHVYQDHASYLRFLASNTQFHRAVAVAAGNQRLVDSITRLLDELTRVFHLGLETRDSAEEERAEHKVLAEVLARRDPDEAQRIVQAQIAHSQQRVLDALMPETGGRFNALSQTVQIKPAA
jgi:DNA-binding GntR family transcriptional regulator